MYHRWTKCGILAAERNYELKVSPITSRRTYMPLVYDYASKDPNDLDLKVKGPEQGSEELAQEWLCNWTDRLIMAIMFVISGQRQR